MHRIISDILDVHMTFTTTMQNDKKMFNCYAIRVLELQTPLRTTRKVSIKKNIN